MVATRRMRILETRDLATVITYIYETLAVLAFHRHIKPIRAIESQKPEMAMQKEFNQKLNDLKKAKREFVQSTKKTANALGKKRDRLAAQLERTNVKIKQTQVDIKKKSVRLATMSKSSAKKARTELQAQRAKLRVAVKHAREEARETRAELAIVRKDLAEARRHLSHALHVDKAIGRVEQKIAERKAARKKAA